jgi:hypothetical protein
MATGDIIFFDEALDDAFFAGWLAADDIKLAICDNTATPTEAWATPTLSDFTQVTAAGTYTTDGTSIGAWDTLSVEAAGTLTFDSGVNPTWAADASNDVDAWWGILHNDTFAGNVAFAYVELGGPVDMVAGSLTVTWNASGIFTLAKA